MFSVVAGWFGEYSESLNAIRCIWRISGLVQEVSGTVWLVFLVCSAGVSIANAIGGACLQRCHKWC